MRTGASLVYLLPPNGCVPFLCAESNTQLHLGHLISHQLNSFHCTLAPVGCHGIHEVCPSLQRTYNPEVQTAVLTYNNPAMTTIAQDAVRAPRSETQGPAVTTLAAWPRNYFRKSTVDLV